MPSFLDYPYNKSYKQSHTDVTVGTLRSNKGFLEAKLEQLENEASEIRAVLHSINRLIQDSGSSE